MSGNDETLRGPADAPPKPGDPAGEAVARLFELYGPLVRSLARRTCPRQEGADDLVQETFLQATRGWDKFRGEASPKNWLMRLAVNGCRRMHRRRRPGLLEEGSEAQAAPLEEFSTPAEQQEELSRVAWAIARLEPKYRIPLILKDVMDQGVEDVAEQTGLMPATVKTRLHRGRMLLREKLPQAAGAPSIAKPCFDAAMCISLLDARQDLLDAGKPEGDLHIACERCRKVLSDLSGQVGKCKCIGQMGLRASKGNPRPK